MATRYPVSLTPCSSTASDAEVVNRTEQAIYTLPDYGASLRGVRKVAIKINAGVSRLVLTDGKQTELTEPAVIEGVVRAVRAATDAEIILGDAPTHERGEDVYARLGLPERLAPYLNVRLVDFGRGELVGVPTHRPEALFARYTFHRELAEADVFVSVAKMKAHGSVGCTLAIKNLFGWLPPSVYGEPRNYLHDRLIRLPRVLADLGCLWRPCLNVVDGIVAANLSEWHGEPLRPGVILAGANPVAVDAVGMSVMGFDPLDDYPDHPFFYRRNPVKLAHEAGLGPADLQQIDVLGADPTGVRVPFTVRSYGSTSRRDEQLRRGIACVQSYVEQQSDLAKVYAGRYLALDDGIIQWHAPDVRAMQRLERESGRDWAHMPQFVVRCVPPDEEIERFEWYARELNQLDAAYALAGV